MFPQMMKRDLLKILLLMRNADAKRNIIADEDIRVLRALTVDVMTQVRVLRVQAHVLRVRALRAHVLRVRAQVTVLQALRVPIVLQAHQVHVPQVPVVPVAAVNARLLVTHV